MAENAASKDTRRQVFDPQKSAVIVDESPRGPKKFGRRKALGIIAAGAVGIVATATGATGAALDATEAALSKIGQGIEAIRPHRVETPVSLPHSIEDGKLELYLNKAKLRFKPTNPNNPNDIQKDKSGHDVNVNTVNLNQIVYVNGQRRDNKTTADIELPEFVRGYNVDNALDPNGAWVRLRVIGTFNLENPLELVETYVYAPIGFQTQDSYRYNEVGAMHEVSHEEGGKIFFKDNKEPIDKSKVGRVSLSVTT